MESHKNLYARCACIVTFGNLLIDSVVSSALNGQVYDLKIAI